MTISAQGVRAVYPGNGTTGPFTLQDEDSQAILFASNAEIVVTRFDADGDPTLLVITTDYSLTGAGSPTAGAVTLVANLAVGETLVIQRVTPRTQLLDLIAGGTLSMALLEGMLDKLIRIDQEDYEHSLRTILLPITYTGDSITFPEPEDDNFIGWDGSELVNLPFPAVLRSGTTNPSDGLGNDGDFYINTVTLKIFGPKTDGAWGVGISLGGPAGPQGPQGEQGEPGDLSQAVADTLYQPLDSDLTAIAALTTAAFGRGLLTETSAANTRTTLGVGTGDSPQFTAVNIGAATDTTIARVSAGVISVEGVTILTTATGQPLDADLTAIAALTTTSFGRSVLETANAAALATLAGVGTGDSPQFTAVNVGNASDTTITRVSGGTIAVEGQNVLTAATGQPLDADLTAIAALTTTTAGRSILTFTDPNTDQLLFWDDSAGAVAGLTHNGGLEISGTNIRVLESFVIACSDEATNITTGTAKVTFRMPYAFTLTAVRASVNTAPTGSTIIIDINENGTTILSTKLSIDASEETSTTAASAAVISDTALADDAEITIDFDQVGSTIPGKGVKVVLIGYRP